jgi:hypothetical protein
MINKNSLIRISAFGDIFNLCFKNCKDNFLFFLSYSQTGQFCYRWVPEVQNILYQGNKRKLVPSNRDQIKLEHFFQCAGTMMTQQLQNLALDSAADFIDLLIQPPVSHHTSPGSRLYVFTILVHIFYLFQSDRGSCAVGFIDY